MSSHTARAGRPFQPRLEVLEGRCQPSVLAYSGFHGGGGDEWGYGVGVDGNGNMYVAGTTTTHSSAGDVFVNKVSPSGEVLYSVWFGHGGQETVGGMAVNAAGLVHVVGASSGTGYLAKLNAAGSLLQFSIDLGDFTPNDVTIDVTGNIYVVGSTQSSGLTVVNAYQPSKSVLISGGFHVATFDTYLMKFQPSGEIVFSTYFALSGGSRGRGIAADAAGNVYLVGAGIVPTTPGAYDTTQGGGGYLAKFDAAGGLVFSTYLPDSASPNDVAIDALGQAYVAGDAGGTLPTTPGALQTSYAGNTDAFVTKLNAAGSAVVYTTFLGGRGIDSAKAIDVDAYGQAYVTGSVFQNGSASTNFPVYRAFQASHNGGFEDGFVTKLNAAGSGLIYSSYLGGGQDDRPEAIAVTATGAAYVAGGTRSPNFPNTKPLAPIKGIWDAFLSKIYAAPNLKVTQKATPARVARGGIAALHLTLSNLGNSQATGVFVTFKLPVGMSLVSKGSTAGWQIIGKRLYRRDVGTMQPGQSLKLVFRTRVVKSANPGRKLITVARVGDDGLNGLDAALADNVSSLVTRVR